MMRSFALIFLLLMSLCPVFGLEKDFIFERISPEAGFAFGAINTVIEDEDGLIWFGCNNGLYYYNTVDMTRYNFDPQQNDTPQSNKINKLYKDRNNTLWVCTENGICYFNKLKNSFTRLNLKETSSYQKYIFASYIIQSSEKEYLVVINNSLFSFNINDLILKAIKIENMGVSSPVSFLEQGDDGRIYVGTNRGEVFISNSSNYDFNFFYRSKSSPVKTISIINSLFWIGYDTDGVDLVDSAGTLISEFRQEFTGNKHLPSNRVRKIIRRKNGDVWVGTYNGIYVITSTGNKIIRQNTYNRLPHNSIYDLFIDKNDGVWAATWSGGIAYFSDYNFRFEHIQKLTNWLLTPRSVISSFAEDSQGNIWVGSESLGLNEYNLTTRSFDLNTIKTNETPALHIKSLACDKKNRLWIGTFDEGLWFMDKTTKKRTLAIGNSTKILNIISSIAPVDSGIWVGTKDGLIFYNPDKKQIKTYRYDELKIGTISSDKIWTVYIDSKGNLWICTDFGLSVKYKDSEIFKRFFYNENASSLSRNIIYSICEDSNGKIWIGTNGGGIDIYDPEKKTFDKFNLNETINNADIYSIIKDQNNNMWFSTNTGIHVYYAKTNTLKSFDEQDGLQGLQFNPNSAFINSAGNLFWGGSNGFNIIDPMTIEENPIVPDVFLSNFLVNNLRINEQKIKSLNASHLARIERIELNHNQNSLIFSFAANNFIKSAKNRFKYRLKNYQDEWTETSYGKDVAFTKIPSGKYVLEIFGSNNDGVWSKTPKKVDIRIYPPFWSAWYAWLFYLMVVTVILFLVLKEIIFREQSRKEITSERFKREADERLFAERIKFFTNVSHELRTPLTLIISPLNNLMKRVHYDPTTLDVFKTMKRNADRLLRLTNQMLDFRLLELGRLNIHPENTEIVSLCQNAFNCFDYQITEKEINFIFTSTLKNFFISIDPDMIEKVVYNLLSNAFKYTAENGQVILSIEQKMVTEESYSNFYCTGKKFHGNSIEIKVRDFGKGMEQEILPQIFDRFFVNHTNEEIGTGIGLHICREYINLHNGNILVFSEIGKGSAFIINIPVTDNLPFEKENIIIQPRFEKPSTSNLYGQSGFNPSYQSKVILLAEDNDELRIYMKNYLSNGFKVLTAKNGHQAYEIAFEVVPDLIISDILMPGIDGLELTNRIRNNAKINHIPVILLTALSENNYKIDSMYKGADSFLTKPVDESMLLAQIDNIFANREKIIDKFSGASSTEEKETNSSSNSTFLQRAENLVLKNLQNNQFDIDQLAKELSISRSSLHRKIKSHTNQSATEFIRDIRLKNAVKLMNDRIYNMDEIAMIVGFNSTSYFNRSFHKKYGKAPKEFHKDLRK